MNQIVIDQINLFDFLEKPKNEIKNIKDIVVSNSNDSVLIDFSKFL